MATISDPSRYQPRRAASPLAIGGVIAVHAGLAFALIAIGRVDIPEQITWISQWRSHPAPKPHDPPPRQPEARKPDDRSQQSARDPVEHPVTDQRDRGTDIVFPPIDLGGGTGLGGGEVRLPDPPVPVLTAPRIDARHAGDFQPGFPAAMIRRQKEGDVVVRVLIDPDGRVREVILISAADPAFFEATRDQALHRWRFVPATRDGVPVASEKVMTVHFRLTD